MVNDQLLQLAVVPPGTGACARRQVRLPQLYSVGRALFQRPVVRNPPGCVQQTAACAVGWWSQGGGPWSPEAHGCDLGEAHGCYTWGP